LKKQTRHNNQYSKRPCR